MSWKTDCLKPYTRVRLLQSPERGVFTIASHERHNGATFYRMKELLGALFLASSFEVLK